MVRFCPICGSYIPESRHYCIRCRKQNIDQPPNQRRNIDPSKLTVIDILNSFPSSSLRTYQKEVLTKAVEAFQTGQKCIIISAPTGFGKSYVNAAFCSMTPSFYATPQLALIAQIQNDPLLKSGFVEIKGRQNYRCHHYPTRSVSLGRCETEDYPCKERFNVCPYWVQKKRAIDAQSILLSFAYLIGESQTEGVTDTYLGSRNLLVLDEAHNIEEQCLNQISVRVSPYTLPKKVYGRFFPQLLKVETEDELKTILEELSEHLQRILQQTEKIAEATGLTTLEAAEKERIARYLENYHLYTVSKSEWIWQIQQDQLTLQPVFSTEFIKSSVWKRANYYIISSATILDPKMYTELNGLNDLLADDEICFLQPPTIFPVQNRPIIDKTVGPLSKDEWAHNRKSALQAVEEILRKEKGNVAIHCHSYRHQQWIAENLPKDLQPRLVVHSSKDREEKLDEWKQKLGRVFVSVAFSEGQDWKYDICDAQILLKVPFPDLGDKRIRRRLDLGYRQWYYLQSMLGVIQAYGRAIRAEDDKARFYIVDGSFKRLARQCWRSIPEWFKEALPSSIYDLKSSEGINMNIIP